MLLSLTIGTPLILLLVTNTKARKALKSSATGFWKQEMTSSDANHAAELRAEWRVLAYGDSLTAGMSGNDFFPYAPSLEKELKKSHQNVVVTHRGWPGWTTSDMLEYLDFKHKKDKPGLVFGLLDAIHEYAWDDAAVVIILAGTNDLGVNSADEISANLEKLHRESLRQAPNKPSARTTVAVGIPSSQYQKQSAAAAAMAAHVNANLRAFCEQEPRAFFQPFPFPFDRASGNWHPDGLHFSEKGYRVLGEALAPVVSKILNNMQEKLR